MTTPNRLKISMKSRNYQRKTQQSLNFAEQSTVNLADREYGLMQVSAASGTPHPRVLTAFSLETLKERLEQEQEKHITGNKKIWHYSHIKPATHRLYTSTRVTDALLSDNDGSADALVAPMKERTKDKNIRTTRYTDFGDITSISSGKKQKNNEIEERVQTGQRSRSKLVSIALNNLDSTYQRHTVHDSSSSSSDTDPRLMSFNERRRLFHEGEFTIAKNGKKMSDNLMPQHEDNTWSINDLQDSEAERAKDAIDMYIRKQGFIKAPSGTLTNLRRFSSSFSKRSIISVDESVKNLHTEKT